MKDKLKDFTEVSNTFTKMVKADPKDSLEIEIGDSKEADFKPQIKIKKWDNEVNFSMRAVEEAGAVAVVEDGKVKYKGKDIEVHQYEKPEAGEDGGYEFEWVLNKKPDSNVLRTTIQHKGLDFFYQSEITDEEAQATSFEGDKRTLEEIKREMSPENVVGSYAVYHKTKRDNGPDKHYKTGKAFHIYRPHAVDADGVKVWCELDITEGELTVTVPEKFLNKASYPVVVDPTFGYTTQGASSVNMENAVRATRFQISENGTGQSITLLHRVSDVAKNTKCNVYDDGIGINDTTMSLITNGETEEKTVSVGDDLATTFNFNNAPSFIASTFYRLAGFSSSGSGINSIYYDGGADSEKAVYVDGAFYGAWPNPSITQSPAINYVFSIYVTYTTSGPSFTPTPQMHMMMQAGGLM